MRRSSASCVRNDFWIPFRQRLLPSRSCLPPSVPRDGCLLSGSHRRSLLDFSLIDQFFHPNEPHYFKLPMLDVFSRKDHSTQSQADQHQPRGGGVGEGDIAWGDPQIQPLLFEEGKEGIRSQEEESGRGREGFRLPEYDDWELWTMLSNCQLVQASGRS